MMKPWLVRTLLSCPFAALVCASSPVTAQENLDEVLTQFEAYVDEGNYPKALEELEWARRALVKAHHAQIEALFPLWLGNAEGGEIARQEVFGMTSHTRRYADADGRQFEVVLTEGAAGNPGLAVIEQLSRLLGAQVNAEAVRIDGRTATLVPEDMDGNAVLTIQLDAGGVLRLTGAAADAGSLSAAAREFDVSALDDYLSGDEPAVKSRL